MAKYFAWHRFVGVVMKEFVQMKRDRATFAMIIFIPLMLIVLFGYAINTDPKHLPTAIIDNDPSPFSRSIIAAMQNSDYFRITKIVKNEAEAQRILATGQEQFVLNIPSTFSVDLIRNNHPQLLLEADATDPSTTGNAIAAMQVLVQTALQYDLQGPLDYLSATPVPIDLRIHAAYNPDIITQYNIVPGLMGVVLTMTMVMITSIAITREIERGTMENLLATPVQPLEVMTGKIIPYIIVGYITISLILIAGRLLFNIPFQGSLILLALVSLPFIAANLSVGLTISTFARTQLQAVEMTNFFFLPSMLLSGFMFPFRGMPLWAQYIGEILPMTHYLRIVRGIILKGNNLSIVWPDIWPILLFMIVIILLGAKRYRRTLD